MTESPETPTPSLADRLDGWQQKLEWLIPWLDTEMQDDIRAMIADADAAAAQLRQLERIKAPEVVAEVTQRVADMRRIAELIEAEPDGIANEDDAWQWRRDAALLAAAYLDDLDAMEVPDADT